jgi:2-keto-3-deoxy-L-rhamnonate aldolase RhmA
MSMENRAKKKLLAGEVVLGAQLRFGSPGIAELFGNAGFDYLVIDSEHAPQTPVGIQHQIQAMGSTRATPIARTASNDPNLMRPLLDMGALGVLVPFINTADEARVGAQALRYPPNGTRGYGPSRASRYGFETDYATKADAQMLYLPIIEDARAVKNLEEILAVGGVDSFVIGAVDLSFSLGCPFDYEHPKFREAEREIVRTGRASGKPMGTAIYGGDLSRPDTFQRFVDLGFTLLLVGGDEWMLQSSCKALIECASAVRR